MLETVAQAFAGEMQIPVERFEGSPPTLAALASAARARGAAATARVLWREAGGSQVSVDVYLTRQDQSTYRILTFGVGDRAAERGRTIGLVLAALILASDEPRRGAANAASPAEASAASPKLGAATPGAATPAPATPPAPLQNKDEEAVSPVETAPAEGITAGRENGSSAPGPWALEAMLAAGAAFGGSASGLGGGLAARRLLGDRWGARLGLHARTGSLPAAQASSLAAGLAGGVFASLRPVSPVLPAWNVGARLDFILGYEMLTHFSDDDPDPVRRGRFLPVTAAWVEGDWRIAPTAMLFLAVAGELIVLKFRPQTTNERVRSFPVDSM